ncbi:MAG: flagellar hook-basal body complex protein FliE [Synergistaceae bacterium]|jgi:flagellar hook-basal body complex protein FliE|nr:flagellar hook-basal body complex protein FliE [Synergistaceae bacterium]
MIDGMRIEPVKAVEPFDIIKPGSLREGREHKTPPFSEVLKDSMLKVNSLQQDADTLTKRLALGEVDDISEVSIAVEKAELALRLMVQIRDKMVDAYQQIARMSV